MQQINTYHCSSAIVEVSLRISEWFFSFFSILYGDKNFPIPFWSFFEDSEFLSVFFIWIRSSDLFFRVPYWDQNFSKNHFSFGVPRGNQKFYAELLMGIRISESFLDFFMGIRISEGFLDFFMGIRVSECFLDFFMGMRISERFLDFFYGDQNFSKFFGLLYGDQNFWMFFGLLYGDQNFWMFFGLLYGDQKFWMFFRLLYGNQNSWVLFGLLLWGSEFLNVFLPNFYGNLIRNSEFSLESFSVIRD